MKRCVAYSIIIAVCIGITGLPAMASAATKKTVTSDKATPELPYGAPVTLRIPRIGVSTSLEKTSVDSKGILTAPKNPKKAGWYRNGAKPGYPGNAIIVGHIDWYDGPAVFYRLSRLRTGDTVEVVNDYGYTLRFRVTETRYYANGSAPMDKVAGATKHRHLNLVTCGGTYSRSAKNYSHRFVVFTEFVSRTKAK